LGCGWKLGLSLSDGDEGETEMMSIAHVQDGEKVAVFDQVVATATSTATAELLVAAVNAAFAALEAEGGLAAVFPPMPSGIIIIN
jgi:hypothetical protein